MVQLKVIKADGSTEQYLHTKVIGTVSNALGLIGEANVFTAEQFAEAITFYLYQENGVRQISSSRIYAVVQSVLTETGYDDAAKALNEYHLNRKLRRGRIEVSEDDQDGSQLRAERWNKSRIVESLEKKGIGRQIARAIASVVEEKILNLGMTKISRSLIKQLVRADTRAMLQAAGQLRTTDDLAIQTTG